MLVNVLSCGITLLLKTEPIFITHRKKIPSCPFCYSWLLATTDLLSVPPVAFFSVSECQIIGILQYAYFPAWLPHLTMPLRFIHVAVCSRSMFLFIAKLISLCGYALIHLSIRKANGIGVFSAFFFFFLFFFQ